MLLAAFNQVPYMQIYPLMILTVKNCVFLNSVQEFIEIKTWLLLTFFVCLHNQWSSIFSITTYWRVQMFEKYDSLDKQKMYGCSFQLVLQENLSWFLS